MMFSLEQKAKSFSKQETGDSHGKRVMGALSCKLNLPCLMVLEIKASEDLIIKMFSAHGILTA